MTRRTLFASIAALFVGRKAKAVAPILDEPMTATAVAMLRKEEALQRFAGISYYRFQSTGPASWIYINDPDDYQKIEYPGMVRWSLENLQPLADPQNKPS